MMTNIQAARRAATEIARQAQWAEKQLARLEAAEADEPALSTRDAAKLYLRLDRINERLNDVADMLDTAVLELPDERHIHDGRGAAEDC